MQNNVTNVPGQVAPQGQAPAEENNQQLQNPTDTQQIDNQNGENSNTQVQEPTEAPTEGVTEAPTEQPTSEPQPTIEELQAKLNEYQVREEEDKALRERLGIQDVDQQTYNLMNIDQQIVNEGKQVYLRLCNEYGIDANPEKLDASVQVLMKTDPAKAYEFQKKFDDLSDEVIARRQEVQAQNTIYEVNKFEADYNKVLTASPALSNIMREYVSQYGNSGNMYGQLKGVMDIILPAYQEAFNAGRQWALREKAKTDTTQVQGGIATAQTNTYQPGQVFTREQIRKMSPEEFAKNEKFIQQQMIEGKIQ